MYQVDSMTVKSLRVRLKGYKAVLEISHAGRDRNNAVELLSRADDLIRYLETEDTTDFDVVLGHIERLEFEINNYIRNRYGL